MLKSIGPILVAFALGGCATADHSSRQSLPGKSYAWDGLGRDPNETVRPIRRKAREVASSKPSAQDDEAKLAALPEYSKEWMALSEAIEARADARLARVMMICRGCLPPAEQDRTGSTK